MKSRIFSTYNIAATGILLAFVVLLQTIFGGLHIGIINLSFVLVPIVMGGIAVGIGSGAFLGFMFGVITIILGLSGADAFTNLLLNSHPFITVMICLVKGTVAGVVPGILFKLLSGRNKYVGVITAALSAPILNTGIFFLGMLLMPEIIVANGIAESLGAFILTIFLTNFIAEFIINIIFAPALYRAYEAINSRHLKKVNNER